MNIQVFPFNTFIENTYVLYDDTHEAVVIDCGCMMPSERNTLSAFIAEKQLNVRRLICTHLHLDHVFGNPYIYNEYGLRPEAHRNEVEMMPTAVEQARAMGLTLSVGDVTPERYIEPFETITFGRSELTALPVPGHSPGSLAFYSSKDGFVIAGDTLFNGGIGRTDLWGGDYGQLITSINEQLLTLPDHTTVYPGHGPSTTIGHEKQYNPFL